MIRSFKDGDTEKVWRRKRVPAFGPELQRAAQKKLHGADDVEITDYH